MQNNNIFKKQVLRAVKIVPKGKVASYGQIASLLGFPKMARHVGRVLKEHGLDQKVPWWRIVNNQGIITIKNPIIGKEHQKRLLEKEGIKVNKNYKLNIKKHRYIPTVKDLKVFGCDEIYIKILMQKFN